MNKIAPSIMMAALAAAAVLLVVGAAAVGSGDGAGVTGISNVFF